MSTLERELLQAGAVFERDSKHQFYRLGTERFVLSHGNKGKEGKQLADLKRLRKLVASRQRD